MQPQSSTEGFVRRHSFVLLFGTLLVFYVLVPIVHEVRDVLHPAVPQLMEGALFIALLTGAVISVARGTARTVIALLLGIGPVVLWAVDAFVVSKPLAVTRGLKW